ncbi:MAG: TonB-dependent receptor plug domain-containing protein [Chitinophagaceae bacterium]
MHKYNQLNGTPGARTDIKLRGINSIQEVQNHLILLDGIEVFSTDINALNLTNVERIEVVQGAASATALWGTRS